MLCELFLFDNESGMTIMLKCIVFHVIAYTKDFKVRLYVFLSRCIWECASPQEFKKKKENIASVNNMS